MHDIGPIIIPNSARGARVLKVSANLPTLKGHCFGGGGGGGGGGGAGWGGGGGADRVRRKAARAGEGAQTGHEAIQTGRDNIQATFPCVAEMLSNSA